MAGWLLPEAISRPQRPTKQQSAKNRRIDDQGQNRAERVAVVVGDEHDKHNKLESDKGGLSVGAGCWGGTWCTEVVRYVCGKTENSENMSTPAKSRSHTPEGVALADGIGQGEGVGIELQQVAEQAHALGAVGAHNLGNLWHFDCVR